MKGLFIKIILKNIHFAEFHQYVIYSTQAFCLIYFTISHTLVAKLLNFLTMVIKCVRDICYSLNQGTDSCCMTERLSDIFGSLEKEELLINLLFTLTSFASLFFSFLKYKMQTAKFFVLCKKEA